jgi:transposase
LLFSITKLLVYINLFLISNFESLFSQNGAKISKLEVEISRLLDAKIAIKNIISLLNKPPRTIYGAVSRIKKKKKEKNLPKRASSGPVTKVTKRAKRDINRDLTRSAKKTNKRLARENNLPFTTRSLQRLLKDEGYSCNVATKKPILNSFKAKNRLNLAKEQPKEIENINTSRIIFSDESGIQRGQGARTEYYQKRAQNRVSRQMVSSKNKSKFKNISNKLFYST